MKAWWLLLLGLGACASPRIRRDDGPRRLAEHDGGSELVVGHEAPPLAPPASDWCKTMQSTAKATIARSLVKGCVAPELACLVDHAGVAWGFEVTSAKTSVADQQCTTRADVRLARRDAAGRVATGPTLHLATDGVPGYAFSWDAARVRDLGDWDEDGNDEVLVVEDGHDHEGGGHGSSAVWTFASGALAPYARAASVRIAGAEDIDGDGKVDLLTCGPYCGVLAEGYDWYSVGPIFFAEHVGAGGALSSSDAAARAFTARKCGAASEKNELIVCDRMRGKTEAAVLADSKKAGDQEPWIPALAAVAPPYRIP